MVLNSHGSTVPAGWYCTWLSRVEESDGPIGWDLHHSYCTLLVVTWLSRVGESDGPTGWDLHHFYCTLLVVTWLSRVGESDCPTGGDLHHPLDPGLGPGRHHRHLHNKVEVPGSIILVLGRIDHFRVIPGTVLRVLRSLTRPDPDFLLLVCDLGILWWQSTVPVLILKEKIGRYRTIPVHI